MLLKIARNGKLGVVTDEASKQSPIKPLIIYDLKKNDMSDVMFFFQTKEIGAYDAVSQSNFKVWSSVQLGYDKDADKFSVNGVPVKVGDSVYLAADELVEYYFLVQNKDIIDGSLR